jgi:hypothetical protein
MADWDQKCPAVSAWSVPGAAPSGWDQVPNNNVGTFWDTDIGGTFWDFGQTSWDVSFIGWRRPFASRIDTQRCI